MPSRLPGQLASLSDGDMYYQLREPLGAEKRPLVVLCHGFACGSLSLEQQAEYLYEVGHPVLSYDYFGVAGHSDAPLVDYSMESFVSTIRELLVTLGFENRGVYLLGYSMGCGVAVAYASTYPDQVEKLLLLDPVHGRIEFLGEVAAAPGVGAVFGEMAAAVKGAELLSDHLDKEYHHPEWPHVEEMISQQHELIQRTEKRKPTLVRAAAKMIQEFPFGSLLDTYREFGRNGNQIPTQVVWGELSKYYPARQDVAKAIPFAGSETVRDAGHMLFIEKKDEVNKSVEAFFR